MIRTYGLMSALSRIEGSVLRAIPQHERRTDFVSRDAHVDVEIHHDGPHAPSLEIGLTDDSGTHRILIPRTTSASLPADGEHLGALLRSILKGASIRSDPNSAALRRRYLPTMRLATLFPDGIAAKGGAGILDLVAATPVSDVRVVGRSGAIRPEALRAISDMLPRGRTTRIQFAQVRGMSRTWEIGGLVTPLGLIEPLDAMERLRTYAELAIDHGSDPRRLALLESAVRGGADATAIGIAA